MQDLSNPFPKPRRGVPREDLPQLPTTGTVPARQEVPGYVPKLTDSGNVVPMGKRIPELVNVETPIKSKLMFDVTVDPNTGIPRRSFLDVTQDPRYGSQWPGSRQGSLRQESPYASVGDGKWGDTTMVSNWERHNLGSLKRQKRSTSSLRQDAIPTTIMEHQITKPKVYISTIDCQTRLC